MLGHGPIWQESHEGEKLLHHIKSYLLFKCENYLQYVTKILKLEKEAPIYISCLQIDCFINTNEESLFVFSSGRALFWVNSAVQAFLSTAKPTWLAKPSREFVVGV